MSSTLYSLQGTSLYVVSPNLSTTADPDDPTGQTEAEKAAERINEIMKYSLKLSLSTSLSLLSLTQTHTFSLILFAFSLCYHRFSSINKL